jgi:hypothetical protein
LANPISVNPAQILQSLRDTPLFVLGGLAVAAWLLLLLEPVLPGIDPAAAVKEWRVYVYWAAVVLLVLFVARLIDRLAAIALQWRAAAKTARRLSFIPRPLTALVTLSKQVDGSYTTQIIIDIDVLNHSDEAVGLAGATLARPKVPLHHLLHLDVSTLRPSSGRLIVPHSKVLLRLHALARGARTLPGSRARFTVLDTFGKRHRSPLIRLAGNPGEPHASLMARLRLCLRNVLGMEPKPYDAGSAPQKSTTSP